MRVKHFWLLRSPCCWSSEHLQLVQPRFALGVTNSTSHPRLAITVQDATMQAPIWHDRYGPTRRSAPPPPPPRPPPPSEAPPDRPTLAQLTTVNHRARARYGYGPAEPLCAPPPEPQGERDKQSLQLFPMIAGTDAKDSDKFLSGIVQGWRIPPYGEL